MSEPENPIGAEKRYLVDMDAARRETGGTRVYVPFQRLRPNGGSVALDVFDAMTEPLAVRNDSRWELSCHVELNTQTGLLSVVVSDSDDESE